MSPPRGKVPPWLAATTFKKGQSGNPLGRSLADPHLRAIARLTAAEVAEIGTLVVSENISKLKTIIQDAKENPDSKHSGLKVWIATVAIKGISRGDAHALDTLLNRLVGRVKQEIEVSGKDGGPIRQKVEAMTPEERKAELRELRRLRKEAGDE